MQPTPETVEDAGQPPEKLRAKRPIFVDLDGTLIAADLGQEAFFAAILAQPLLLITAPIYAAQGLAKFKSRLAQTVIPPVEKLPYHADVIAELRKLKAAGHPLILATASHQIWAEPVARHLNLFDDVLATTAVTNLKGANKLAAIEQYCQDHKWSEFEYWGDAAVDLRIWSAPMSARIVAVNPSLKTLKSIQATNKERLIFANRPSRLKAVLRAMRPQQWIKNLLFFVPILLAHQWDDASKLAATFWAFVAFSLTASGVYIVNDMFDAANDRQHPVKHKRPFATGTLPLIWGPFISLSLFTVSHVIIWIALGNHPHTATRCSLLLLFYTGLNLAYSLSLKRRMVIDVICLAGMYTLRILMGGIAAEIMISKWLLAFSIFIFTSLAFAKRFAELARLAKDSKTENHDLISQERLNSREASDAKNIASPGRGYTVHDLEVISSIGPTCGFLSILVLAMYISSDEMTKLYKFTFPLWLICPVMMYWITRLWFIAHRNQLNEDPIVFAIKDRVSWAVGLLILGLALSATYLEQFPGVSDLLFAK